MINLFEAKDINKEYETQWSTIPREIFDSILLLDPQTNINNNFIGPIAKQLLLPKYLEGETDFLNYADDVKKAVAKYGPNRRNYPEQYRNALVFPSVKSFVDYINNDIEPDISAEEKEQKSNIDNIYDKYYKDIDRNVFDEIIHLDPETNEKSIGSIARVLLLNKYKGGEKDWLNDKDALTLAINNYIENKNTYTDELKNISNYASVADFIEKNTAEVDSSTLAELKASIPDIKNALIASTPNFDIFKPRSFKESKAINHTQDAKNVWCTGGGSDGAVFDDGYWNRYKSENKTIFTYINKLEPRNRKVNFNQAVSNYSGQNVEFRDGDNDSSTLSWKSFLYKYPDVALAIKDVPDFKEDTVLADVLASLKYQSAPYIFNGVDSEYVSIIKSEFGTTIVKEIIISDKAGEILPMEIFANFSSLEKVTFSDKIKVIGSGCFMNCPLLNNLVLPKNLVEIKAMAFANCVSLKNTIQIPDSCLKIGREAFLNCRSKLSVNKNRTTPLHLDIHDKEWYKSHLQARNLTNESLYIFEDILDENLPRDLRDAYANVYTLQNAYRGGKIKASPDAFGPGDEASNHLELGYPKSDRRFSSYDYGKANYEVVSADEAINRLRQDPRDINKIRALYKAANGKYQVAEWAYRSNNSFYNVYKASLTGDKLDALNALNYPDKGSHLARDWDTKWSKSFEQVSDMLKVADKIYWTDEYEHKISQGDRRVTSSEFDDGKLPQYRSDSPIMHNPSANYNTSYGATPMYRSSIADTGDHTRGGLSSSALRDAYRNRNQARKNLDLARRFFNQFEKEIVNDPNFTDEEKQAMWQKRRSNLDNWEDKYREICDNLNKLKAKEMREIPIAVHKAHERIADILREYSNITSNLYDMGSKISDLQKLTAVKDNSDISNSSILNKLQKIDEFQKRIDKIKESISDKLDSLKLNLNEIEKIDTSTLEGQELKASIEDIEEMEAAIKQANSELSTTEEAALKIKFDKLNHLLAQQEHLVNELNDFSDKYFKGKFKPSKPQRKELDKDLDNIVAFDDYDEETENSNE